MNVEIEAEAALFPEKEYIKRIFVAVYGTEYHFSNFNIFMYTVRAYSQLLRIGKGTRRLI
jgi:hypothetical protein